MSAADPLDHPDASRAGEAAATETLLRAYVRDLAIPVPAAEEELILDFPATGVRLRVPVRHRSPTGWHRFGEPLLAGGTPETAAMETAAPGTAPPETAVLETATSETTTRAGATQAGVAPAGVALVAAVVVRETAVLAGLPAHRVSDADRKSVV